MEYDGTLSLNRICLLFSCNVTILQSAGIISTQSGAVAGYISTLCFIQLSIENKIRAKSSNQGRFPASRRKCSVNCLQIPLDLMEEDCS